MNKLKKEIDYLIVAPLSTLGQIEYYNERKRMLNEMGYSCRILTLKDKDFFNFIKIPGPPYLLTIAFRYRLFLNIFLKENEPKIIEFQNNTSVLQNKNIFRKYKTIISFDYPSQLKLPWYYLFVKYLERNKFKKSNFIIGRSEYALNYLNNYNIKNHIFIPHSIPSYKAESKLGKKKYILYYCSPKCPEEKGLDILINFWKAYAEKNRSLRLEIVGISKEDSFKYLNKKKIELPTRVNFLGELKKEDYLKKVRDCFFMVNTARVEEFGKSILECLAEGKIIFTTPTTGAKEIIGRNNSILISREFTPESLIKNIKIFEKNPKKIKTNLDKYLYTKNKIILKSIINKFNKEVIKENEK